MSFDLDALSDRLYADAIATGLRSSTAFCDVRLISEWTDVEFHVRERAAQHAVELSASSAAVESALGRVKEDWHKATNFKPSLREIERVREIAKTLLQQSGCDMVLRVDRVHPGREILRWRFISLAVPSGILIAAATEPGSAVPTAVRILDPSIAPDSPVAQNHLHHAALPTFEDLWVALRVRVLTRPGAFRRSIHQTRAYCPGLHRGPCLGSKDDGKGNDTPVKQIARAQHMAQWADLIRQAFIARRVIDRHVHHRDSLNDCVDPICITGRRAVAEFIAGQAKPYSLSGTRYPWPEESKHLVKEVRESARSAVKRQLAGASDDLLMREAACERLILARAFTSLQMQRRDDPDYEKIFLQYLRVKTALFGLLVHSPGHHGLDSFVKYFTQIKVYAQEASWLKPRIPCEPGLDVRATEYRVAPDAWLETLRYDQEIHKTQEAAWIIHFQRKGPGRRLPLYGTERRGIRGQALRIASALTQKPTRLQMLRGIDICGVEGSQPLWVSAQALHWLRTHSRNIAASRPASKLEPLRLTLHAGEDFSWLTSGVRAIAEPFEWGLIERGDRIGHGIAITLAPQDWWTRHAGKVKEVTYFDRLLDLAFLGKYSLERSIEEDAWLQCQIEQVVSYVWPKTRNDRDSLISEAIKVWHHLGGLSTCQLIEASTSPLNSKLHEDRIHKYLWDRGTQRRAHDKIRMIVQDDGDFLGSGSTIERNLLGRARAALICEIAQWQVCLESNPSSNLVIASLDSMASQDFLQIRPTSVLS